MNTMNRATPVSSISQSRDTDNDEEENVDGDAEQSQSHSQAQVQPISSPSSVRTLASAAFTSSNKPRDEDSDDRSGLHPDPIMSLHRIIGFNGKTSTHTHHLCWSTDGQVHTYKEHTRNRRRERRSWMTMLPCHAHLM